VNRLGRQYLWRSGQSMWQKEKRDLLVVVEVFDCLLDRNQGM
jgi:hypothetical protein